jgi:hypothetical protein
MYSLSHHLYSQQTFDIKWIKCLEKILNDTGFSNIWQTQTFKTIEWLKQKEIILILMSISTGYQPNSPYII